MHESEHLFAARLAALRERLDVPPGVMAGVLRLPILDPILDELDAAMPDPGTAAAHATDLDVANDVVGELQALAELLLTGMLGSAPETVQRRVRIVELLRRADSGRLPALVADPADAFGEELRAMLASDDGLRVALGALYPLTSRATSVAPPARWRTEAAALLAGPGDPATVLAAPRRVLAALLRAEVVSRPDILVGGLRPANQRFVRGLLWFAAATFVDPVDLLKAVGLRMGTSGRSDAVVRDAALANSAAVLLGDSTHDGAAAALASMRLEVINRNVLKQVDRALAAQAARAGVTVDELVDSALPRFGLNDQGMRQLSTPAAMASIRLAVDGHISIAWRDADGEESAQPTPRIETAAPDLVAQVAATVDRLTAALDEERRRLELMLGSERAWPHGAWRQHFADHPIARVAARTLVWTVDSGGAGRTAVLWVDGEWLTSDEQAADLADGAMISLWHPVESTPGEILAWRATLAERGITQAVRQADREVFMVAADDAARAADLRHAGRIVDHGRLRSHLGQRGWAVPALGSWDQGDEATAWRSFDAGLRAELRYQSPERIPAGERVERARLVAVRFIRTEAPPASVAREASTVLLADVPPRVFSESLRDVDAVAG
jgi:Domain of unknown function (DUF4132)